MRYFKCKVDSNISFKPTYYIAANEWFTLDEIEALVTEVANADYLQIDDDNCGLDEEENIVISVLTPQLITTEEAFGAVCDADFTVELDIQHLDNRESICTIGRIFSNRPQDRFYIFAANAGQDADVTSIGTIDDITSIGVVDKNIALRELYEKCYTDCMCQLKRYFQTGGYDVCTGTFVVQMISEDEYELERANREVVFDSEL